MTFFCETEDGKMLEKLNIAVQSAVDARTKWLDENAPKHAKFQIGDEVYDMRSFRKVGYVVRSQRRNRGDATLDKSISLEQHYATEMGSCSLCNVEYFHGTKDEAERMLKSRLEAIIKK